MKIYIVETSMRHVTNHMEGGAKNYLISYWYDMKGKTIRKLREQIPDASIMLDSGAYTAYQRKKVIDVNEYIKFVNEHMDVVDYYVALDVIRDGPASYDNYLKMKDAGLKPMPVHHLGDDIEYLKKYCKDSDYVGIGGATRLKTSQRQLFNYVNLMLDVIPKTKKVHLFGTTSFPLLFAFAHRIESCDSSMIGTTNRNNTAIALTGLAKGTEGIPGRINPDLYDKKDVYMGWRIVDMENQINEFVRRKTVVEA